MTRSTHAKQLSSYAEPEIQTDSRGKRVIKTIRQLSTRLVLETEAGLVSQWMWYRLDRRQDTSELEHSLRSRDAPQLEQEIIASSGEGAYSQ